MRVWTVVVAGAAVVSLAACGGGSSKKAATGSPTVTSIKAKSTGSSSGTSSDVACKLMGQDDATQLFGTAAQKTDGDGVNASAANSVCLWKADDAEQHSMLLQVHVYNDTMHYGETYFPDAKHVDGLGEKAFTHPMGSSGVEVQFVKNGTTYDVAYPITNVLAKTPKNASDQLDQLESALKANASRV
jgi:hypothetical protein